MYVSSSLEFVILLLINFCIALEAMQIDRGISEFNAHRSLGWRQKNFLFYRSNAINERACTCSTLQSCRCCENVTLLLIKTQRRLCANLMYQRNGLNIDISMDSNTVRSMTVTTYRPMQLCTSIPGSLFSGVCLHLVELNAFPRSLTICPRFTILTKNQEWKINYTCISLSTELPAVNTTTAPIGTAIGPGDVRVPMSGMIILAPGVISPGSPALAGTLTVVSTPQGVVTPAAPPPPPVSAATTVGGTPAATTASRPAPLIATSATPAGGPTLLPGDLAARLQTYGATDRAKYFPSRHPPAYAPNFGHNITEIELLA